MSHLYLVESRASVMPSAYVEAMASTAMDLLSIKEDRDISLIMGFPVHIDNKSALCCWIQNFLSEYPDQTNFKASVFPALRDFLKQCESELGINS